MKRERRNHVPSFKAKVALAALKDEKPMVELAEQSDVPPNQIQDWRRKLLENAEAVFDGNAVEKEETPRFSLQTHFHHGSTKDGLILSTKSRSAAPGKAGQTPSSQ